MSTYIKEYVNDICGSQISKIHLLKGDEVRVFFKNDNGKTFDRTFSKRDIAEFLNQTIETEEFVITQDIENSAGQIKPVKPKRNFLAECVANFIYNFVEKSFLQL